MKIKDLLINEAEPLDKQKSDYFVVRAPEISDLHKGRHETGYTQDEAYKRVKSVKKLTPESILKRRDIIDKTDGTVKAKDDSNNQSDNIKDKAINLKNDIKEKGIQLSDKVLEKLKDLNIDKKTAMGAAGATAAGLGAYGLYKYLKNKKKKENQI